MLSINFNYNKNGINNQLIGFDLKEIDPYTQSSFETLINQSFTEDYVHNHQIINPMTRQEIKDFHIYVISSEESDFKLYMNKDSIMQPPNHLPLFWNNPNRSVESRVYFLLEYGKHLENSQIELSINAYEIASSLGSITAKLRLSRIYGQRGNKDLTIKWLKSSIDSEDISVGNAFCCGKQFEMCERIDLALEAYTLSAEKGSLVGLAELIKISEQMQNTDNRVQIEKWRQKLPETWREALIEDFFKHLKEINYDYKRTGYP